MKVFVLPSNIASMPAITVDRLNKAGIEARAVFIDANIYQDYKQSKAYQLKNLKYGVPQKLWNSTRFYADVIRGIMWADIIHWYGTFSFPMLRMILPWVKIFDKPGLIEWVGSDIRIPEVEFTDNPFYKEIYHNGYEYAYESYDHSRKVQKIFKKFGFKPVVFPGMEQYIQEDIFPEYYSHIQRIDLQKYIPIYPNSTNKRPIIVHAPTAPICKGTAIIEKALDILKKEFDFEYILVHKMSRELALETINKADIFIDQLILGSYGMATMEAFAMGKPVVCYMKDSVLGHFPGISPIVNANPDNLVSALRSLISDPELRNAKGVEGRKYAEMYHDIDRTIVDLISIYEKEIKAHKLR